MFAVQVNHESIPMSFGYDGRCRDAMAPVVSFYERFMRPPASWKTTIPVNQKKIRICRESLDRAPHCFHRSPQNIQLIYFFRRAGSDPDRCSASPDFGFKPAPIAGAEFFAVADSRNLGVFRKNYRCGDHRPSQAATSRLIYSSD